LIPGSDASAKTKKAHVKEKRRGQSLDFTLGEQRSHHNELKKRGRREDSYGGYQKEQKGNRNNIKENRKVQGRTTTKKISVKGEGGNLFRSKRDYRIRPKLKLEEIHGGKGLEEKGEANGGNFSEIQFAEEKGLSGKVEAAKSTTDNRFSGI